MLQSWYVKYINPETAARHLGDFNGITANEYFDLADTAGNPSLLGQSVFKNPQRFRAFDVYDTSGDQASIERVVLVDTVMDRLYDIGYTDENHIFFRDHYNDEVFVWEYPNINPNRELIPLSSSSAVSPNSIPPVNSTPNGEDLADTIAKEAKADDEPIVDIDENRCFGAATTISLAGGHQNPISEIDVGDVSMSFDAKGFETSSQLWATPITAKHTHIAPETLDFHGTVVTPGHMFLTGDGSFRKLAEILEEDGTVVWEDGTVLRARTKYPVGSLEDRIVMVAYDDPESGATAHMPMRAGVPFGMKDGAPVTLLAFMRMQGYELGSDGLFINIDGETATPMWDWGVPPDQFHAERPVSFA